MKKTVVLLGPPGAGKGTHAVSLVRDYNLFHISTGDLLRKQIADKTDLGMHAKSIIEKGELVPDSVVESMIEKTLDENKDCSGFIFDGFPRTISQAEDLDKMLAKRGESLTMVLSLAISDQIVRERIKNRATIEGRKDDASDEVISNRIATYHKKTEPLINFYKNQDKYFEVDSNGGPGIEGINKVYERITDLLKKINFGLE